MILIIGLSRLEKILVTLSDIYKPLLTYFLSNIFSGLRSQ